MKKLMLMPLLSCIMPTTGSDNHKNRFPEFIKIYCVAKSPQNIINITTSQDEKSVNMRKRLQEYNRVRLRGMFFYLYYATPKTMSPDDQKSVKNKLMSIMQKEEQEIHYMMMQRLTDFSNDAID